jgi:CubicO group peptidase (beta-lactamase class C family)
MRTVRTGTVRGIGITALLALASVACTAQSAARPADAAARIDDYLGGLVKQNAFSGSVLVARDGTVVLSKGYGMANLEHDVANTPQTKFRLASVSKQFTAMAVVMLQERGRLRFDDSVCAFLDDCPPAWKPVTIHHLLNHTSGIPSVTSLPDFRRTKALPASPAEMIAKVRTLPLQFAPGERFAYNNSGYIMLGMIVEKASGMSYEQFLRENVFKPLGMANTGYDTPGLVLRHRADGYLRIDGGLARAEHIDMTVPYSAGGLYSTVEDLYLWDQALYTEKLVSKRALDTMFTPFKDGYAYGFGIGEQYGLKTIGHGGGIEGFATFIRRFPNERATVIVLGNIQNADSQQITGAIARILLADKMAIPVAVRVDPAALAGFAGRYQRDDQGPTTDVRVGGAGLVVKVSGQGPHELKALSPTTFFDENLEGARFSFEKDATGAITGFTFSDGSRSETHRRLALPEPSLRGNTEFRLKGYPDAAIVALAGSFNGWRQSTTLFGREGGEWVCRVDLPPGTHEYKFIVDGDWMLDPANSKTQGDGRGNVNSVLVKAQ